MTTLTRERLQPTTVGEPPAPSPRDDGTVRAARERLTQLLAEAAALDLDDLPGWARMRAEAHATTSLLCAASLLPRHLHVRH